jgi:PAS domain S-box-containing protein
MTGPVTERLRSNSVPSPQPSWLSSPRACLSRLGRGLRRPDLVLGLLLISLLLLPVVMLWSVSGATVAQMELQADEISTLATGIRAYYADNVIARLQAADGQAVYSENYRDVHGGIPIPATLSIELGALFDNAHSDGRINYRFLSDYPFAKRVSQPLDAFEKDALAAFRTDSQRRTFTRLEGNGLGRSSYRLATPVLMRQACVTCHNSHPDSPRRDWKVGDVRGIQEVTVRGLRVDGFGKLNNLLIYTSLVGIVSVAAVGVFRRQSQQLVQANRKLLDANQRESALAARMTDQLQELSIFGSVVDDSIVGITIADMRKPDAPLIYVNKAFTVITGYPRELAVGFNCRFLQGPDTSAEEVHRIRDAIQAGLAYTGELINYRQDGTRFWNRLTLYPVGGVAGRPDFYVANQVDATSIKQKAGVPIDDLRSLQSQLDVAQQALDDADRFGLALRERYAGQAAQGTLEMEAFLRSEQQAHQQLDATLTQMAAVLRRHVTSAS